MVNDKTKILVTGGEGRFAKVLKEKNTNLNLFFASKKQCNILNLKSIESIIKKIKPKIILHCAGLSRPMDIHEKNINKSIDLNIIGTANITKISKKYNIKIIEDCAQSQGAKYKNKFVGNFGEFGCFSFYPTKILGAYGDGGFILTNDYDLYKKIKRIRFYGIETIDLKNKFLGKYYANENGVNSRLDEIQSSILNFKLKKIDYFIKKRRQLAKLYIQELKESELKLPYEKDNCEHVYHLFTVYHPKAMKIITQLKKREIETRIVYPYPIHKMKAYSHIIKNKQRLANSESTSKGIFSLPLYPELKIKEVKKICKDLIDILEKKIL